LQALLERRDGGLTSWIALRANSRHLTNTRMMLIDIAG
jgi:hypothetical protein